MGRVTGNTVIGCFQPETGAGLLEHRDRRIDYSEWGGLPAGRNLEEGEWELVNEADLARPQRDGKNTRG